MVQRVNLGSSGCIYFLNFFCMSLKDNGYSHCVCARVLFSDSANVAPQSMESAWK